MQELTSSHTTNTARPLRVLHLISSRGLYGAERVAIELCSSLKRQRCEPVIGVIMNTYNPHKEVVEEAENNSIAAVVFPCKAKFDSRAVEAIRTFVRKKDIDIIHCHGYKSNFYALLARRKGMPLVATNHNWLTSHWKLRIYRRIDSLLIRFFNKIVAVSEGVKNDMLNSGVPAEKISVIDNGIDLTRFQDHQPAEKLKRELGISLNELVVGTIGNLGVEKGHTYLLQAARNIFASGRAVKMLIVGEGPLLGFLKQETEQYGLNKNVIFTGFRTDIPELLSIMDLFVLPSIKEGLPMVLLEAMAAQKPVIATSVGAIPNIIQGENGILVAPGDVQGLEDALSSLLADDGKRRRYAEGGYETVRTKYSSDRMSARYLALYKEVMV